jgi:sugar lactone lactonase YvrE
VPFAGELLLASGTAQVGSFPGAVFSADVAGGLVRLVAYPEELENPRAISWGGQKIIYVGDDDRILAMDPYAGPTAAPEVITHPYLVRITDILPDGEGGYYILDSRCDPFGDGGRGAVLHLDPASGEVTLIASDFRFRDPRDMLLEEEGTLLIVDPQGKAETGGERDGAIFRVDPVDHTVVTVASLDFAVLPTAIAVLEPDTLLIVDADASVPGFKDFGGAVFKLSPETFDVLDTLAVEAFRNPIALLIDPGGDLVVLDEWANPGGYTATKGALFQFDLQEWELVATLHSPLFMDLATLGILDSPEISESTFRLVDDSDPLLPGDRLLLEAIVINSGLQIAEDLLVEAEFGWLSCFLGSASVEEGTLSFDGERNALQWLVTVGVADSVRLEVEVQVPWITEHGTWVRVPVRMSGATARGQATLALRVVRVAEPGDVIFTDAGADAPAPRLFYFDEGDSEPLTFTVDPPESLGTPVDVTFGADGMLYVLDRFSINEQQSERRVLRVDPSDGSLVVIHRGEPLTHARAICLTHDGALLIADPQLPPPFPSGAVYRLDLASGKISEFFSHPEAADPVDVCPDRSGHYLVTDYESSLGGYDGSVIEIDAGGELVAAWSSPFFRDPISATVDEAGNIYVADFGYADDPQPWMITKIERAGHHPSFSAVADLVPNPLRMPYGIEALSTRELLICEREKNPLSGRSGSILTLTDDVTEWNFHWVSFDDSLRHPERMAIYRLPDVVCSELWLQDLSGGNLVPGDTLVAHVVIDNHSPVAASGTVAMMTYPAELELVDSEADVGETIGDEVFGVVQWFGDVQFLNPHTWTATFVVDPLIPQGEQIEIRVEIVGTDANPTFARKTVRGPLRGGEYLVLDSQADAFGSGDHGTVFLLDLEDETLGALQSHALLVRPCDLLSESPGRLMILDSEADPLQLGQETGALFAMNPVSGGLSVFSAGVGYVDPARMLADGAGGLLVLDAGAQFCPGEGLGAILRVGGQGGSPETLSCPAEFRAVADMVLDPSGRLWVSDMQANPEGLSAENTGAIFAIDTSSGAVVEIFSSTELMSPAALAWLADGGLLFSDLDWTGPFWNRGLRRLDPETGEIATVLTSAYLSTPMRMTPTSDGDLLVIDSTGWHPSHPDAGGMVFLLDVENGWLSVAAPGPDGGRLAAAAQVPLPEVTIARMGAAADSAGMWVSPGDTLHCAVLLVNASGTDEPWAALDLEFSETLWLDPLSAEASSGALSVLSDGLAWEGPLDGWDSVEVRYCLAVNPAPGLPSWGDQEASLTGAVGGGSARKISHHIATTVVPSELLIVDSWANPRGFGFATGAVFRIEGTTREAAPLLADSAFTSPVAIERLPGSFSDFLVVDADASPGGVGTGGALFRASTRTGEVFPVFYDSTLSQPIAVALLDSTTCFLLDQMADPLGLEPASGFGPGAIYRVNLQERTGEVFFSDTVLVRPVDLCIDPLTGALLVTDSRAGGAGQYTGAVFEIDPSGQSCRTVRAGQPFQSPRCAALSSEGDLYIADPLPQGGTIFCMSRDGEIEASVVCGDLVYPTGMVIGSRGRPMVVDAEANPMEFPTPMGSVLRFFPDAEVPHCSLYRTGLPFARPRGATVHFEGSTPVTLVSLELNETAAGVTVRWSAPPLLASADFFIYRKSPEEPGSRFACLNRDLPVQGAGELLFLDPTVTMGEAYEYLLVGVTGDGTRLSFGPYWIRAQRVRSIFALSGVAPNPFPLTRGHDGVTIRFQIPSPGGKVRLSVFDVAGRLLRDLVDEPRDAGSYTMLWDGRDRRGSRLETGLYFLRLQAGHREAQRRVLLIR